MEKKKIKIFKISKISKISKCFEILEKTQHFDILKKFGILRFCKISKILEIFENFENLKNCEKKCDRNCFQPKKIRFFFDDLFRSQISPRFQKSHLENRVMS